jgi:predicted ATPase
VPELLRRQGLVSVVGPPGVGKTRLAVEVAHRVRALYPAGVWWVDLSSVTRGCLIRPAVTAATGPGGTGREAWRVVAEATETGAALLVVDNCEHLLDEVSAAITELRAAAPQLRVLTTSRESLRAPGETVMALAPLRSASGQGRSVRGAEAVRLFAARARDVRPDFDTDAWGEMIAEICDRLDGLPLAIEFAARQSDILTPDQLLPKLSQRMEFPAGRGSHGRHNSLRSAFQWSYDLLDDKAKTVFARLCILPGGFDQHTAAAITGDLALDRAQLWALLSDLTRKSMIASQSPRPGRFRILESLRVFGHEVLADTGGMVVAQTMLFEWLVSYESRLARNPWGQELNDLVNQMATETDNVRYAVDVAAALGHRHHPALVVLIGRLYTIGLNLGEANRLVVDVVRNGEAPVRDRVSAASIIAINSARMGDPDTASRHAGEALELAREVDDVDMLTAAVCSQMVAHGHGDEAAAGIEVGARRRW